MSKVRLNMNRVPYLPVLPFLPKSFKLLKHHLSGHQAMLREWRFWVIVIPTILVSAAHTILETVIHLPAFGLLYFVPSALFLIPVVFAALTFGLRGALVTSLTATVITIPNWVFFHESWETLGCISQLFVVNIAAYFIGKQTNKVRGALQQAKAARTALAISETKYRRLFESSPNPILVLDVNGAIQDANLAAGVLFTKTPESLKRTAAADLLGTTNTQKLLGFSRDSQPPEALTLKLKDGLELYVEPAFTQANDIQDSLVIQLHLRDVTEERMRQAGLRAYAAHVLHVQEEERQHIARELHDVTIQQLVLLYRQLDSSESLPQSLVNMLKGARGTIEEVIRGLRDFTRTLRPSILDDIGLEASIRTLLSGFMQRSMIKGRIKIVGQPRRLPPDVELGVFRVVQEALSNVERHARATQVAVTITFDKDKVRLEVVDNGVGFTVPSSPGDFSASGQLGLISMQERAKLLNGKLEIQSSPNKGTRVIISIPV
ncbi:MAG: PAS domain-containing sensor histidine kinase [Dehalococcoidales bacterium]|nr:PAS domain-containing sensor histidine kinase [Dehalococcoidales bacterium]